MSATIETDLLERGPFLVELGQRLGGGPVAGRLVLLGGEAGVGKTVLLRRFCLLHRETARAFWGTCDPLFTPRPLGPLPHIADAPLDVLRLVARRVEVVPALFVASYRDDELDRFHPLRTVLGDLATLPAVSRLRLLPLSPASVEALARPYGVDADDLYRKTGGNPFYVTEVLSAGGAEVPPTVRDAVLARVARLHPAGQRLLEYVAIVPARVELSLLATPAGHAFTGPDECLSSGMLQVERAAVAFRHELARLAVEDPPPDPRRITPPRGVLSVPAGPAAPAPARLAHHAEAADDAEAVL